MAVALLLALCFLGCAPPDFGPAYKARVVAKLEQRLAQEAYAPGVDFTRWAAARAKHQQTLDRASSPTALERSLNEALNSFGISHLRVYTPEAYRASQQRSLVATLGLAVLREGDQWFLARVFEGGPAHKAGLQPGDRLQGLPLEGPAREVFGPREEGRVVKVTFTRNGQTETRALTMAPLVLTEAPSIRRLDGGVVVLRIPSFDKQRYAPRTVEALLGEARGAKALILDLRDNGGGAVNHAAHLLSHFFEKGRELFHSIDRKAAAAGQVRHRYKANPPAQGPLTLPMAVLVTPNNGSGGELVPAVLQERGRAKVLGMKTMGAVLGSRTYGLDLRWGAQLPIMEVLPPSGRSLEGRGVTPDVVLSADRLCPDDPAYQEARRVLGL